MSKAKTPVGDVIATGDENPTGAGHNSVSAERLRDVVERIEHLEEERKALGADIRDMYLEAKGTGFDVKVLRALIRIRRQEPDDIAEHEALLEVYRHTLGM